MAALHLRPWDDQRLAERDEDTGRKYGQTAGSHISDLVALKKAIMLCGYCLPKFSAAGNGYVTSARIPFCSGKCDGCKDDGMDRRLFIHHQNMPR